MEDLSCVWGEIVSGMSIKAANNSIWSGIQRLVFGAAVYFIWQERNFRIFQNRFRTDETVFRIIVDTVRHKLLGLKIKRSLDSEKAAIVWKFPLKSIHGENSCNQNNDRNMDQNGACLLMTCRFSVHYFSWCFWFCLGTGIWKCNQVFDRGECNLVKLLCTTEARIASCAGHRIMVLGCGWLCTTGTDSTFCAGNLYWFLRSRMSLMSIEAEFVTGTRLCLILFIISRFAGNFLFGFGDILRFGHLLLWIKLLRRMLLQYGLLVILLIYYYECILPEAPDSTTTTQSVIQLDVLMLAHNPGGKERIEKEFEALTKGAGFKGVHTAACAFNTWVMEFTNTFPFKINDGSFLVPASNQTQYLIKHFLRSITSYND
ncbi:Caffeate O-methyltransferase (COMT) family [Artemisia annua]|uniref:Caffeate O-methyltransferase (COMT) family n=1 Tax=Artemisia annua TaxID=35608 RepID=A0A2U1PA95_ARTAN|nr:Caffeate O-methyltransferase (COMT) family [Artemisia annua]